MNFGQAFLILFALANSVVGLEENEGRDLATSRDQNTFHVNGFHEELGVCTGAVCGLWGDPHILTCDGLGYDCNAQGLFTLMKNHLFNIQANFVHVNSEEMKKVLDWGNFPVATYTNDIIIENVQNDDVPVMQFSFPNFHTEEGIHPSERECFVDMYYWPELAGYARSWEPTIEKCRERCEGIATCTKFTYKSNTQCRLAGEDGVLHEKEDNWSRRVSGPVEKCGHGDRHAAVVDNDAETAKAKVINNGSANNWWDCHHGPGCPVLYYENGVLQDISQVPNGGYLYGDAGSDNYVKLEGTNQIKVVFKTEQGGSSEIMLETAGDGPGELFSCHWNFFVCLPQTDQALFSVGGVGILGSPDLDSQNDWMEPNGNVIPIHHNGKEGQEAYDYCRSNWCVNQVDSLMTYPEGTDYDDVRCPNEDYVPIRIDDPDFACVVDIDFIHSVCDSKPMMLRAACEVECCVGNCAAMDDTADEIVDLLPLSGNPQDCVYPSPSPTPPPICDDDNNFLGTGANACPTSSDIVKVIHSSTSVDIPNDQPVIYGITFKENTDDDHGRVVTFRVDNPFSSSADAYVRYSKNVGFKANDPACEVLDDLVPGCDTQSQEIEVGCIEYPGQEPFAVVDVYFASSDPFVSSNADPDTEVERCCQAPDYDSSIRVIQYSYKIQCTCPTVA